MPIPFPKRKVARAVALEELAILEAAYPAAVTALAYRNPFELLVAVILSAQCTDARVNLTTPHLFAAYPDAQALAAADLVEVERIIKSCGFFRMKAKNIVNAARALVAEHGGQVPREREQLEALPGVGRKTAAVVLSVAFEGPAFAVDTHVFRVAHRLGLTLGKTPRAVEDDVTKLLPPDQWRHAHHWLILHGRAVCKAPTPLCSMCPVTPCPSRPLVQKARLVAVRPPRSAAGTALGPIASPAAKSAHPGLPNSKPSSATPPKPAVLKAGSPKRVSAKEAKAKPASAKAAKAKPASAKAAKAKPASAKAAKAKPASAKEGKATPAGAKRGEATAGAKPSQAKTSKPRA